MSSGPKNRACTGNSAADAKPRLGKSLTLGREGFAKISGVEGVHLSAEMKQDFQEFDRKGLSADERRRAIVRKYGKKRT